MWGLGFNICCGMLLVGSFRNGRYVKGWGWWLGFILVPRVELGVWFRVYFSGYG